MVSDCLLLSYRVCLVDKDSQEFSAVLYGDVLLTNRRKVINSSLQKRRIGYIGLCEPRFSLLEYSTDTGSSYSL